MKANWTQWHQITMKCLNTWTTHNSRENMFNVIFDKLLSHVCEKTFGIRIKTFHSCILYDFWWSRNYYTMEKGYRHLKKHQKLFQFIVSVLHFLSLIFICCWYNTFRCGISIFCFISISIFSSSKLSCYKQITQQKQTYTQLDIQSDYINH